MNRKRTLRNGWAQCNILVPPETVEQFHNLARDARESNDFLQSRQKVGDMINACAGQARLETVASGLEAGMARLEATILQLEDVIKNVKAFSKRAVGASRRAARGEGDAQLNFVFLKDDGSRDASNNANAGAMEENR